MAPLESLVGVMSSRHQIGAIWLPEREISHLTLVDKREVSYLNLVYIMFFSWFAVFFWRFLLE